MADQPTLLAGGGSLDLARLAEVEQAPAPFTPGEPLFWDDPHISKHLLAAHLDPDVEAASRRPETIERSVAWLVETLGLEAGDAVLDLGCGPGLYASRLARRGLHVTGVDYSRRSIEYATEYAREHNLEVRYRYQNYLTLADEQEYDAVLLIYGDFCVLAPQNRRRLLDNVRRALRPGGTFAFDVSTRAHRARYGVRTGWYVSDGGFWKPGPHMVLERGFDYPDKSIYLDQYAVVEPDGTLSVYRNWFQDYTPESISGELEASGFRVEGTWSDLAGTLYTTASEWIGLIARPV